MKHDNIIRTMPNYLNINFHPERIENEEAPYQKVNTDKTGGNCENNIEKVENFKKRLEPFKSISTLKEAKELLQKTMPIALDRTTLYIGDAKCIITNYEHQLRICLDSPREFISYDFN